jgi:hypothetical protein
VQCATKDVKNPLA